MNNDASNIMQAVLPQELMSGIRHVILVGGSFDPVHLAHMKVAIELRSTLPEPDWRSAWLVFVPAAVSPFKVVPASGPAANFRQPAPSQRVELLRLAVTGIDRACVWTDEIDRAAMQHGPSYTIDTVRRALCANPQLHIRFMIGADQASGLHRWREAHQLITLAQPMCVLRPPVSTRAELRQSLESIGAWSSSELDVICRCSVHTSLLNISSTAIRTALASGIPAKNLSELDPRVAARIDELGLYRVAP